MNGRLKKLAAALLLAFAAPLARADGKIAVTYITPPLNVPSMVEKRLGHFAKNFGLPVEYVVLMNGPEQAHALAAGRVDAALVTGVPAWRMARAGYTVLRDGDGLVGGEVLSVTTEAMLRDHPDLVKKFLAARRETLRWIADHRDEAVRIAAEELDLSPEDVEAQLPLYDFSMEITLADAAGLQRTADFMAAQGMMERPIDVRSLFAAPRP